METTIRKKKRKVNVLSFSYHADQPIECKTQLLQTKKFQHIPEYVLLSKKKSLLSQIHFSKLQIEDSLFFKIRFQFICQLLWATGKFIGFSVNKHKRCFTFIYKLFGFIINFIIKTKTHFRHFINDYFYR